MLQGTLVSRPNLETLISKTDLDLTVAGPTQRDALISRLATDISVKPDNKLNLFSIQVHQQRSRSWHATWCRRC